jgi:hypothetical protein
MRRFALTLNSAGLLRRHGLALMFVGSAIASIAAFACGPGDDKPPMTPDPTEHPADDAGAPPAAPAPAPPK